jgi:hypothetical protein
MNEFNDQRIVVFTPKRLQFGLRGGTSLTIRPKRRARPRGYRNHGDSIRILTLIQLFWGRRECAPHAKGSH